MFYEFDINLTTIYFTFIAIFIMSFITGLILSFNEKKSVKSNELDEKKVRETKKYNDYTEIEII